MSEGRETPPERVALLGASNLTWGFGAALDAVHARLGGGPLDVHAAAGHGRSYGMPSRVLIRELPGILTCGLWESLRKGPERPLHALLTDIGNDLVYGAPPAAIVLWIRECVHRLRGAGSGRPVVTLLPEESVRRLRPWQLRLARAVLFPGRPVALSRLLEDVAELNQALEELGREEDLELVEPRTGWFGVDGIHIRRRHRREAWAAMTRPWRPEAADPEAEASLRRPWTVLLRPARIRWLGLELRHRQPVATMNDGCRISLY